MTNKELASPSSDNVCRTIKATYAKVSGANIILQKPDRGGGKLYGNGSNIYI